MPTSSEAGAISVAIAVRLPIEITLGSLFGDPAGFCLRFNLFFQPPFADRFLGGANRFETEQFPDFATPVGSFE